MAMVETQPESLRLTLSVKTMTHQFVQHEEMV